MNKLKHLGLGVLLGGALSMGASADDKSTLVSEVTKPAQPAPSRIWWAYQPVQRPADPVVKQRKWVRTPVDAFILAKLEAKNLKPSPDADRAIYIRRVTLDTLGYIPTLALTLRLHAERDMAMTGITG